MKELAAKVDIAFIGTNSVTGQRNTFQKLEWVTFHDLAVFKGSWF